MVEPVDVILVGQTPPPVHGQALAIERLVRARFDRLKFHHVPMDFSSSMDDVGRFRLEKVFRLLRLIWRVLRVRFRTGARILYYPPAGPALVPVLRDMVFLTAVRPVFPILVLDFHAGGLEGMRDELPGPLRTLFDRAYHDSSLIIEKYPSNPGSARFPTGGRVVVPYGIEDELPRFENERENHSRFVVLFVGLVSEAKGIRTFTRAMALLAGGGIDVEAVVVGEFPSQTEEHEWNELVDELRLRDHIRHAGRLVGDAKWNEFRTADVFCFPSHYENEALPIVIIEAMQFGLPVVASEWRGIPYLVDDGESGFLVPPKDPEAVAARLHELARRPGLRRDMGSKAREAYLRNHTVDAYLAGMEEAIYAAVDPEAGAKQL